MSAGMLLRIPVRLSKAFIMSITSKHENLVKHVHILLILRSDAKNLFINFKGFSDFYSSLIATGENFYNYF